MIEIALIVYLWLAGAYGLYDLYDAHGDNEHCWLTAMCCAFWPAILPIALIWEAFDWLTDMRYHNGAR